MRARRWQLNRPIAQGDLCTTCRSVRAWLLFAQFGACTLPGNLEGQRTAYLTAPQGIKEFVLAIGKPVVFGTHQQLNLGVAWFTEQFIKVGLSIHGADLTG